MKTAISLPDHTFDRVTRRAGQLGISRSELFARAAGYYLDALDADSTTQQIDSALRAAAQHPDDGTTAFALELGRRTVSDDAEPW